MEINFPHTLLAFTLFVMGVFFPNRFELLSTKFQSGNTCYFGYIVPDFGQVPCFRFVAEVGSG